MHVTTELLLTGAVLGVGAYIVVKQLFAAAINASERIGDAMGEKFPRKGGKFSPSPPPEGNN